MEILLYGAPILLSYTFQEKLLTPALSIMENNLPKIQSHTRNSNLRLKTNSIN